jgi:hypothetical protein
MRLVREFLAQSQTRQCRSIIPHLIILAAVTIYPSPVDYSTNTVMDPDAESIPHDGSGASDALTAEPGPGVLRAYLLKDAVFQDLEQVKAKVS